MKLIDNQKLINFKKLVKKNSFFFFNSNNLHSIILLDTDNSPLRLGTISNSFYSYRNNINFYSSNKQLNKFYKKFNSGNNIFLYNNHIMVNFTDLIRNLKNYKDSTHLKYYILKLNNLFISSKYIDEFPNGFNKLYILANILIIIRLLKLVNLLRLNSLVSTL